MAYNSGSDPTLAEAITRYFIPKKYSNDVIMHTMSNLVVGDAFTHRYESDLRQGDTVYIPIMTEGSTTEVTPNTEPTAVDSSTTGASISIDQWREHTSEISPLMKIEQVPDYLENAAKSGGYAIRKAIDTYVGTLLSTLTSSSVYGSDGQTFTDDIFIALVETLDTADVPDEGRFLIGDPSTKADMLKIDKFVRMDYINGAPTSNGKFGMLYGATVYTTNNLTAATTGNYGVYAHPNAIGVVIQKNPNAKHYDLGWKFIEKIIVDAAYGAAVIQTNFGKAFYTRSA